MYSVTFQIRGGRGLDYRMTLEWILGQWVQIVPNIRFRRTLLSKSTVAKLFALALCGAGNVQNVLENKAWQHSSQDYVN